MNAMRIALCDDEKGQLMLFRRGVEDWAQKRGRSVKIEEFDSAQAFWFVWSEDKSFDLLVLDIRMPGMDGMELARKIRASDSWISIIFATSLREYVYEGYNLDAINYLVKPVEPGKLEECLDRAQGRMEERRSEGAGIVLPVQDGIWRIPVRRICRVEAEGRGCILYMEGETLKVHKGIGEMEELLREYSFVRCHRSFLVPVKRIRKIGTGKLLLDDGSETPVGRSLQDAVNRAFVREFVQGEKGQWDT